MHCKQLRGGEKPDQETLLKLKDERLVDIANVTHMQSPGQ